METEELFRLAVKELLRQKPWITQKTLANKIGVSPANFNDFLQGRRSYPDDKRERIAFELGTSYLDLLQYGKGLTDSSLLRLTKESQNVIINGREINLSEVYSKVRFILAHAGGDEKKYLLDDIARYYGVLKERAVQSELHSKKKIIKKTK